jgi:hypothetical protein
MPAALYKLLFQIGNGTSATPPVWTDHRTETALYTSRQWQKHLLCATCENRFARNGEAIVVANCYRGKAQFRLRDNLRQLEPSETLGEGRRVYFGDKLPKKLNAKAYSYFALSLLWRGSVIRWNVDTDHYYMSIDPAKEQTIREFLLGGGEFPKNTVVHVLVNFDDDERYNECLYPPSCQEIRFGSRLSWTKHSFMIPGILFEVIMRGDPGTLEDETSEFPRFFEWKLSETELAQHIAGFKQTRWAKGKLAKEDFPE